VNVYVETNFVLELVFQQEQFVSCEQILQLLPIAPPPNTIHPQSPKTPKMFNTIKLAYPITIQG
jgi:hypothetical protein